MKWTKWLSLLLIVGGVLFIGYGVWNIMDTKAQTENSLSEAKAAINNKENEKWVDKESERFVPPIGDAVGLLEIEKIDGVLPIVEGTDPDDLEKESAIIKAVSIPMKMDKLSYPVIEIRSLGEQEN